jgi:hypothetical protein
MTTSPNTPSTPRKSLTWLVPVLGAALVLWYYLGTQGRHSNAGREGYVKVECQPFQASGGWGYDIMVNGKSFIHQDRIPGMPGIKTFASREDALKVGHLMVEKLKEGAFPPNVSYQEMKNLGVELN